MPKYLYLANYAVDGVRGLIKEGGSSRVAAVEKAAQSVGGKIESFYFAFGDVDAYIIAELPDNAAAAAMAGPSAYRASDATSANANVPKMHCSAASAITAN